MSYSPWDFGPFGDDDYDDHYADVESFETHYADEIAGVAVTPVDDIPSATAITNAPGQLRFSFPC